MNSARTLPAVLLLAALASASSCEKDKKTKIEYQYAVTLTAELALDLRYPNDRTRAQTCPGTQSWLVRLDETGDGTWEYSLLFNSDFSALYGCSTGECADLRLGLTMTTPPARAMLEGLTIAPDLYAAATGGIDVTCRGIADTAVAAGDITTEALPTPTGLPDPGPEPTAIPASRHTLTFRMLTVGNSNPLPYVAAGPAPADLRFGAGASFSNRRFDIGMAGESGAGIAVFAGGVSNGGVPSASVWEFDPRTLVFTSAAGLGLARAGLTATAFQDAAGPAIVFAGGAAEGQLKTTNVDVYRPDASVAPFTLAAARAFHAAALLPRDAAGPAIVLAGGGEFTVLTQTYGAGTLDSFDWFKPAGTTIGGCSVIQGDSGICPGTATMGASRMRAGGAYYLSGTGRLWLYGGADDTTQLGSWTELDAAGSFLSDQQPVPARVASASVYLSATGSTGINDVPILIGGHETRLGDSAADWAAKQVGGGVTEFTEKPTLKRGTSTAAELRDKTALLIGGKDTGALGGIAPLERLEPTTAGDGLLFEFLPVPGATCTSATGVGCAALTEPRWGHTSIRLDATDTWLDGAVLIVGGGADTGVPAELFVPALTCDPADHLTPVSPVTHVPVEPLTNATLPALCDRDRAGEPITAPDDPL